MEVLLGWNSYQLVSSLSMQDLCGAPLRSGRVAVIWDEGFLVEIFNICLMVRHIFNKIRSNPCSNL
jgi:hypothetical protein